MLDVTLCTACMHEVRSRTRVLARVLALLLERRANLVLRPFVSAHAEARIADWADMKADHRCGFVESRCQLLGLLWPLVPMSDAADGRGRGHRWCA